MYPDEQEVLIEAGLKAKVESFKVVDDGDITYFNLYISDNMVKKEKRKRTLVFALPVIIWGIRQILISPWNIIYIVQVDKLIDAIVAVDDEGENEAK